MSNSVSTSPVQQRIDELVKSNRVVLFMKGTAQFPQCGFLGCPWKSYPSTSWQERTRGRL